MAAGDGLVSMTPASIAHSGTSATINADGGVDFTAVTELNLNGVFTSAHDNYVIFVYHSCTSSGVGLSYRLRSAGSDASGSNYTRQNLAVDNTSIVGTRSTSQTKGFISLTSTSRSGDTLQIYGPNLAQPTASRSITLSSHLGSYTSDEACTHSLSTAYDGITIYPDSGNITGNVHVFGYEE